MSSDVLAESDCAATRVEALDTSGAWVAQPMMINRTDGRVDSLGHWILPDGFVDDAGHGVSVPPTLGDGPFEIFGAFAGAAMYRAEVIEKLGVFPADVFIYYEDVDLPFRIREAGGPAVLVPRARAFHRRHGSAGGFALKWYYAERNFPAVMLAHYTLGDLISRRGFNHLQRGILETRRQAKLGEYAFFLAPALVRERLAPARARREIITGWAGVERKPAVRSGEAARGGP